MPLSDRVINVTFAMPNGPVILDQGLHLHVRINKAALAIQNKAVVEVYGLAKTLREQLLSQFSLWNRQLVLKGQNSLTQSPWVQVDISAGYATAASPANRQAANNVAHIFKGSVAFCEPIEGPPNVGVRITCYTRQIDKTDLPSNPAPPPLSSTFKGFVTWAAGQMGFGTNFICDTSFNDVTSNNIGGAIHSNGDILLALQDAYAPDIAAFVDDDILIVKDRNKILNPGSIQNVTLFIGAPGWTEYGVEFTTLFDPTIKLAQGVTPTSKLNPSLNGTYCVTDLEYDLSSREQPFYVTVNASPPA